MLFGELIRHDCFSHDAYLCDLIRRGNIDHMSAARIAKSNPRNKHGQLQRHYDGSDTVSDLFSDCCTHAVYMMLHCMNFKYDNACNLKKP